MNDHYWSNLDHQSLISELEDLVRRFPNDWDGIRLYARVLGFVLRFDDQLAVLRYLHHLQPESQLVRTELFTALLQTNRLPEARVLGKRHLGTFS